MKYNTFLAYVRWLEVYWTGMIADNVSTYGTAFKQLARIERMYDPDNTNELLAVSREAARKYYRPILVKSESGQVLPVAAVLLALIVGGMYIVMTGMGVYPF